MTFRVQRVTPGRMHQAFPRRLQHEVKNPVVCSCMGMRLRDEVAA